LRLRKKQNNFKCVHVRYIPSSTSVISVLETLVFNTVRKKLVKIICPSMYCIILLFKEYSPCKNLTSKSNLFFSNSEGTVLVYSDFYKNSQKFNLRHFIDFGCQTYKLLCTVRP